jgi:hypothetical protein
LPSRLPALDPYNANCNTQGPKKSPARRARCGTGQPSHDMPVYWGSITGKGALMRAIRHFSAEIRNLPNGSYIFRTSPTSPPAAAAVRPARPAMDRRQMSRRACRMASSQTTRPDAQSGLAAKIRGVDQVRRPRARGAARRSHFIFTLPEKTSRQAQGMPREIN